jgi:hypothetical protein
MATNKLEARMRLTSRFRIDGAPGDAVLLEFAPELDDAALREWVAVESGTGIGSTGGAARPVALQIRVRAEIAKEAFVPGEAYTLTLERTGRGT